ncbi:mediator of RNA polymerase II transcription subunit 15a-like [Triticum dicoccoides]|uniref:mediator of RNA polymerase II transcription subunit 15a-like n=1 Tax=Triticum dicoccoides TaxID=85692 RepID=UPI00189114BE|nr:mediator of RNA polymerase II transcription subunit 15a-like [Triticum dicoccoides]
MDANWRPTQGSDPAAGGGGVDPNAPPPPAGGDWRAGLQPDARARIVNKITETLKKHLPASAPDGVNELQKIAVRFEEKIYTAATNQSDYLRKISLKMLSMETKTQQAAGNAQVIPNQNNSTPGLPSEGSNQAQPSAIPLMSQQQARQPNTTSVQASSLTNIGQNLPGVNQTSTMQNVSVMPQNTMNNGLAQGTSQDIYAAQRQMAGRQQQQQSQQLIYQQQQMLMKQKLQQNSLMQPHIQQQQSLLQPTQMQSTQQSMMQMSSGLHPVQSTVPQTQPMSRQSVTQSGIQQNQLNSVQQSVPSLLQQPQQSVGRQQQQAQPSMHQQPSLQRQQPNIPLQQQQQQQQQLMGQQPNLERNQLIGQQNGAVEMQQQQRLPAQSNNLLNVQQTQQQMLNQQSMPLHQPQQLGSQANMSSLQQQQQNQQQQRMHMLQMKAQQTQQQQHAQQSPMGLMQPQSQNNQLQQSQQHLMSQFQSQPNQLQQQLGMQQQSSMQQRLQTSGGMLLQQNNMDQQKQFIQAQRGLQEVSSSTSADSTTQTGLAGAGDWQEEIYQMIKSLKDQYFAELSDLSNKISMKLQHVDSIIPPQKPSEQYDRMKNFKNMLDRILQLLQISKSTIQPAMRDKVPQYEKQIISILSSQRRKPVQPQIQQQFQPPAGQAPNSSILQQQQTSQNLQQHDSHTNPQASLSSMSTGLQSSGVAGMQHVPVPPTTNFSAPTQQNGANIQHQAVSNMEAAQGGNLNSLQHGSVSGALQQGNTGLMQGTMNTQLQTSSGMLSHNSMSTMQPNGNSMQANASSLQQLKQQQQDHHMMQSQQMKRQMFQQYQQKQQMLQQQFPIQQQSQKQQQVQMQVPQLHAGNDVNESKARQGTAVKPGIYQQHLGQRSNYYHPQLKQGGAFPISSPQNLQQSSPQISHHSPQVDQHNLLPSQVKTGTPLNSANSPYVPSPSPSVAPSPIPVDSDKQHSNISSLTNTGQTGHQQTSLAPQTQSIAVNTPGISASPLLAEFTSVDGNQANMPTQVPTKSNAAERPMDRLLKALRTTQHESLNAAVSDIRSVVSMMDRIAGSAPGNGSRTAVGEDLVAMTKCRLQARNFIANDGSGASKKMKRDISAMPLNVSSAGSVDDSFKQTFSVDTPDLQSTATSRAKRRKIEVNHALLEEIEEINQGLIDTTLRVCEDDDESPAATSEGTVIKCTYTAVAVSPSLKSMLASAQTSPIMPLRLLVPAGYPKCSPVLLDKFLDEQRNSDDLSSKAKSKFGVLLRGLEEPMSLREIARTWDACARGAIAEYAQKSGGGSFSSSYGRWETCVV